MASSMEGAREKMKQRAPDTLPLNIALDARQGDIGPRSPEVFELDGSNRPSIKLCDGDAVLRDARHDHGIRYARGDEWKLLVARRCPTDGNRHAQPLEEL